MKKLKEDDYMAGPTLNEIRLLGRLTKDPERTDSNNGSRVKYTLAVEREFQSKDNSSNVDYINCVAFNKLVDPAMNYLTKGSLVLVSGALHIDSFTDQSGKKVNYTNVVINKQIFLSKSNSNVGNQQGVPSQPNNPQYNNGGYNNVPPQNSYQQGNQNYNNNSQYNSPVPNYNQQYENPQLPPQNNPPSQNSAPQQNELRFEGFYDDFFSQGEPF